MTVTVNHSRSKEEARTIRPGMEMRLSPKAIRLAECAKRMSREAVARACVAVCSIAEPCPTRSGTRHGRDEPVCDFFSSFRASRDCKGFKA